MMYNITPGYFSALNVMGRMKHRDLQPVMKKASKKNCSSQSVLMAELYILNTNRKKGHLG